MTKRPDMSALAGIVAGIGNSPDTPDMRRLLDALGTPPLPQHITDELRTATRETVMVFGLTQTVQVIVSALQALRRAVGRCAVCRDLDKRCAHCVADLTAEGEALGRILAFIQTLVTFEELHTETPANDATH